VLLQPKQSYMVEVTGSAKESPDTVIQPTLVPRFPTKSKRVIATHQLRHAMDHYGELVLYLRMNRIVAPASRHQ